MTFRQANLTRGAIDWKQDGPGRIHRAATTFAGSTLAARRDYTYHRANRHVAAMRQHGRD